MFSISNLASTTNTDRSFFLFKKPGGNWKIWRDASGLAITTTDKEFEVQLGKHLAGELPTDSMVITALAFRDGTAGHVATRVKIDATYSTMTVDDDLASKLCGMCVNANICAFAVMQPHNDTDDYAEKLASDLVCEMRGNAETKSKATRAFAKVIKASRS